MVQTSVPEIVNGRPAWEMWDEEDGRAWEAFQHYRDQGPKRTYLETSRWVDVARITDAQQRLRERYARMGLPVPDAFTPEWVELRMQARQRKAGRPRSVHYVSQWSKAYRWYERAVWFDRHMDRVRVETARAEIESMVRRHLTLSGLMQNKAATRLQTMEPEELTVKNVMDYLIEGMKIERLTRDQTTENTRVTATVETKEGIDAKEALRMKIETIRKTKDGSQQYVPAPSSRGVLEALNDMDFSDN